MRMEQIRYANMWIEEKVYVICCIYIYIYIYIYRMGWCQWIGDLIDRTMYHPIARDKG